MNTTSDAPSGIDNGIDRTAELQQRADRLEREIAEMRQDAEARLVRAELKAEAIRAGMVDLDGLKLMDASALDLDANGAVTGAAAIMDQFKKAKPWLFGGSSSSSPVTPPPARPARTKLATEMTETEYKTARAAILKQRD